MTAVEGRASIRKGLYFIITFQSLLVYTEEDVDNLRLGEFSLKGVIYHHGRTAHSGLLGSPWLGVIVYEKENECWWRTQCCSQRNGGRCVVW